MDVIWTYRLRDRYTDEIRYVGQTIDPKKRLKQHCKPSKNRHKWQWIKGHLAKGSVPIMELINKWHNQENANADEIRLIAEYRTLGYPLTNLANGGKGLSGYVHSAETRGKVAQATRLAMSKPEVRQKLREAQLGKTFTPETRLKIAASNTGRIFTPETRLKIAQALTGVPHPLIDPDKYRERLKAMRADPSFEAKRVAGIRRKFSNEEYRAHLGAMRKQQLGGKPRPPEVVAKMSATAKARAERLKREGIIVVVTDETRAKLSESLRVRREKERVAREEKCLRLGNNGEWLTVQVAATTLNCHSSTINKAARSGDLPVTRIGKDTFIRVSDLHQWNDKRITHHQQCIKRLANNASTLWRNPDVYAKKVAAATGRKQSQETIAKRMAASQSTRERKRAQ